MERADFLKLTAPKRNSDQLSVHDGVNPNFSSPTNKALFYLKAYGMIILRNLRSRTPWKHFNIGNIFSVFQELDPSLYQRQCMDEEVADEVTEVDWQPKSSPIGCQLMEQC